jgi:hypothetical protein
MSTHNNTSLGQCQRQCMVSTYFGYKVFIHKSPLRAPGFNPGFLMGSVLFICFLCLLWSVFALFVFGLCVVYPMLPVFSGLSLRFSPPFIYYLNYFMCLMCPMFLVSLNISFSIAPLVFSSVYLELK